MYISTCRSFSRRFSSLRFQNTRIYRGYPTVLIKFFIYTFKTVFIHTYISYSNETIALWSLFLLFDVFILNQYVLIIKSENLISQVWMKREYLKKLQSYPVQIRGNEKKWFLSYLVHWNNNFKHNFFKKIPFNKTTLCANHTRIFTNQSVKIHIALLNITF